MNTKIAFLLSLFLVMSVVGCKGGGGKGERGQIYFPLTTQLAQPPTAYNEK